MAVWLLYGIALLIALIVVKAKGTAWGPGFPGYLAYIFGWVNLGVFVVALFGVAWWSRKTSQSIRTESDGRGGKAVWR